MSLLLPPFTCASENGTRECFEDNLFRYPKNYDQKITILEFWKIGGGGPRVRAMTTQGLYGVLLPMLCMLTDFDGGSESPFSKSAVC